MHSKIHSIQLKKKYYYLVNVFLMSFQCGIAGIAKSSHKKWNLLYDVKSPVILKNLNEEIKSEAVLFKLLYGLVSVSRGGSRISSSGGFSSQ